MEEKENISETSKDKNNDKIIEEKENIPNPEATGFFTLSYKNGDKFTGQMTNGKVDMHGIYEGSDGITFEGDFLKQEKEKNNERIKGKLIYENGNSIYEGEFLNGKFDGKGILKNSKGDIYEGFFKSGLKERKCENCGKTDRLELHHINGDPSDNRIENLKILCIECHYDTDTYRNNGRGRKHASAADLILNEEEREIHKKARILSKRNNISIEEAVKIVKDNPNLDLTTRQRNTIKDIECPVCHKIFKPKYSEQIYCSQECSHKKLMKSEITKEKLIEELKRLNCNLTQVGKVFNMTDNAIRKWCIKFNMPKHSSELKEYIKNLTI